MIIVRYILSAFWVLRLQPRLTVSQLTDWGEVREGLRGGKGWWLDSCKLLQLQAVRTNITTDITTDSQAAWCSLQCLAIFFYWYLIRFACLAVLSTKYFTYLDLLYCRYIVWSTRWVLLERRVRLGLCQKDIINRPRDYKGIYLFVVGVWVL